MTFFWQAHVFITPPNDDHVSEEDSGDEESPSFNINQLCGRQMQCEACTNIRRTDVIVYFEIDEKEPEPGPSNDRGNTMDATNDDDEDDILLARLVAGNLRNQSLDRSGLIPTICGTQTYGCR
ncbi:hypothetical protein HHI36_016819 [Cryptolaemus montrouzieri]|uniref:Uncharacterized protein n=1 Tax=Cryptolaemus montrouzieri TaxID=559131 RepID=A0ABD2NLV7_9CUCU